MTSARERLASFVESLRENDTTAPAAWYFTEVSPEFQLLTGRLRSDGDGDAPRPTLCYADSDLCAVRLQKQGAAPKWWAFGVAPHHSTGVVGIPLQGVPDRALTTWSRRDVLDALGIDEWRRVTDRDEQLPTRLIRRLQGTISIHRTDVDKYRQIHRERFDAEPPSTLFINEGGALSTELGEQTLHVEEAAELNVYNHIGRREHPALSVVFRISAGTPIAVGGGAYERRQLTAPADGVYTFEALRHRVWLERQANTQMLAAQSNRHCSR